MPRKKESKESAAPKTYKVIFHTPDFFPSRMATNIVVQPVEDNFKVLFYELIPDIILSDDDRLRMEKRGTLRADCVGSFIISPKNLKRFIDIMQEQHSKYETRMAELKKSNPSSISP